MAAHIMIRRGPEPFLKKVIDDMFPTAESNAFEPAAQPIMNNATVATLEEHHFDPSQFLFENTRNSASSAVEVETIRRRILALEEQNSILRHELYKMEGDNHLTPTTKTEIKAPSCQQQCDTMLNSRVPEMTKIEAMVHMPKCQGITELQAIKEPQARRIMHRRRSTGGFEGTALSREQGSHRYLKRHTNLVNINSFRRRSSSRVPLPASTRGFRSHRTFNSSIIEGAFDDEEKPEYYSLGAESKSRYRLSKRVDGMMNMGRESTSSSNMTYTTKESNSTDKNEVLHLDHIYNQFFMLSVREDDLRGRATEDFSFFYGGENFLDPFLVGEASVIDSFEPTTAFISEKDRSSSSFDPAMLSPFCFPRGVQVRIFPRKAADRANEMGWFGKASDRYQVHVFTDGCGVANYGVAVTVREAVPVGAEVLNALRYARERRQAALVISRWWRSYRERLSNKNKKRGAHRKGGGSTAGKGDVSSWLSTTSPQQTTGTCSDDDETTSIQSMFRRLRGGCGSSVVSGMSNQTESTKGTKRSKRTKGKKISGEGAKLHDVLSAFIKSSPLPRYDKDSKTGIWRSAKLKISHDKKTYTVIVRHAVLDSDMLTKDSKIKNLTEKVQAERSRLLDSLSHAHCGVNKVIFEEIDDFGEKRSKISTIIPISNEIKSACELYSEAVKYRAHEAFEEMLASDQMGDICVAEKSYVLLGAKPEDLASLFVSLEHLIDLEREGTKAQVKLRQRVLDGMKRKQRPQRIQSGHGWQKGKIEKDTSSTQFLTVPGQEHNPQVIGEWGIATLLLRIGGCSLMKVLKLLLLERSLLVIGTNTEEVSVCVCALLELLEPYEWASTFLPLIPESMVDFLLSPVPLVVGIAVECEKDITKLQSDARVKEAYEDGMAVVNLATGTVSMSPEHEDTELTHVPSSLSKVLETLAMELEQLIQKPHSAVNSLKQFVHKGSTRSEKAVVSSVRERILRYMIALAGDLAIEENAWKWCGKFNEETDGFDFYPEMFLETKRAELDFLEQIVHTQMFVGYVDSKRRAALKTTQACQA